MTMPKSIPEMLQLGHVLSDMVRKHEPEQAFSIPQLQLGHVLSDMVRDRIGRDVKDGRASFNWAMSFQTW